MSLETLHPSGEPESAWLHYRVAAAVMDRFRAGETYASLAYDYNMPIWAVRLLCFGRRNRPCPNPYHTKREMLAALTKLRDEPANTQQRRPK